MEVSIPIEIERKYLIKRPSKDELAKIKSMTKVSIMQTYLHSDDPTIERRVRQRGDGKNFSYYYTEKREISGISRSENERKISQEEYISLLLEGEKRIRKDRYCFVYNNQYFELDIYPEWESEAILEIELTTESQSVDIPGWIHVIKEVTDDPAYKNKNLAKWHKFKVFQKRVS